MNNAWKRSAKMFRRLTRRYIREYAAMEALFWNLAEELAQKADWAAIWKIEAKAYRAMSLSQQDALDRYARWIDPAVELPEPRRVVAVLMPASIIALAFWSGAAWRDPYPVPGVIGWHPLPELPACQELTTQQAKLDNS